jgi:hypothetical protein
MVSIIELDEDDGDRVQGLSIELTEGAETVFNEIDGPRSFQPRWFVDVLIGTKINITSVNEGFDGNCL